MSYEAVYDLGYVNALLEIDTIFSLKGSVQHTVVKI
jgi:hypothetical protein